MEYVLAALDPLPITPTIARVDAQVRADVEAAGTPVGAHDLWIAATAIAHGLAVVTAGGAGAFAVLQQREPGSRRASRTDAAGG